MNGTIASTPCINVFHVLKIAATTWSQAEIDDMVTKVRGFYVTRFIPLVSAEYALGSCDAVDLSSDVGVVASAAGSTPGTASGTGNMTANVACTVTWKIARHYRGGHPRTYLAPPTASQRQNANSWTATHALNVQNAAVGFKNDIGAASFAGAAAQLVCVHRFRNKVELVPPLVDAVVDATCDTRVDSQRRRLGPDR